MKHTLIHLARILILPVGLCTANTARSQEGASNQPSRLVDVFLSTGTVLQSSGSLDPHDLRAMLPGSLVLQRTLPAEWSGSSHYSSLGASLDPNAYGPYSTTGQTTVVLGIGLRLGVDRADRPFRERLRLGVLYSGSESDHSSWGRSLTGRYDTLVSQATGESHFVDTTFTESLTARVEWSRIGLDAAYLVQRNTEGRWTWQLGLGFQVGSRFDQRATLAYRVEREARADLYPLNGSTTVLASETHRLPSTLWGDLYGAAGLEFCLGRKGRFMHAFNLFYEARPMLLFQGMPNGATSTSGRVQHLAGLRFDLR